MRFGQVSFSALLIVCVSLAVSAQVDHSAHIEAIERNLLEVNGVQSGLAERMKHYRVPGVSIAVIADYRIVWARGYGVTHAGPENPLKTGTLFQSGSLAKPVMAMAVLALTQQGRLELDRDVNAYLNSWKLRGPSYDKNNPVTFRLLLSHTAGIGYERVVGYRRGRPLPTLMQILDGLAPAHNRPVRIEQTPGASFVYANSAFLVAQLAIEETLQRGYPDVIQTLIFAPLDMNDSHFAHPLPEELIPRVARGHTAEGNMVEGGWRDVPELGATGLWTTPSDIARYLVEIMNAATEHKSSVLTSASAREMLTAQAENMGLSVFIYGSVGKRQIQHGGAAIGYRNMFIGYPAQGLGAVVMTNGDQGYDLINEIMLALAREYNWSK